MAQQPAAVHVTHEELETALQAAQKGQLIAAIRAIVTRQAWEEDDEFLRNTLRDVAHDPKSSHAEVYNAVVNGA